MKLLLILTIITGLSHADVKSVNGIINFDINSDQQTEMKLSSSGLGIGVSPSANLHVEGNAIVSQKLSIGFAEAGTANLHIQGSIGMSILTISSNTSIDSTGIVLVDSSSDNVLVRLPYAGNVSGRIYTIKKISPQNKVWLSTGGGNFIDNDNVVILENENGSSLSQIEVISNGSQWYILNSISTTFGGSNDNLIGWWPFEETSGNTAQGLHSTGNTGSLIGFSDVDRIDGKIGKALRFSGNAKVDLGTDYFFKPPLSLSAWVYPEYLGNNPHVFIGNGWQLRMRLGSYGANYKVKFSTYGTPSNDAIYSDLNITNNKWYHIAMTWDGTDKYLYINGALSGNSVYTGTLGNAGAGVEYIGYDMRGIIDDFRIYNKAINHDEVMSLYHAGQ